jgi:hypothetical protein
MESLFLLAGLFLFGVPVMAIIALIRTGGLRRQLDEQSAEHQRSISALSREIDGLRHTLWQLSAKVDEQSKVSSPVQAVEARVAQPEPVAAAVIETVADAVAVAAPEPAVAEVPLPFHPEQVPEPIAVPSREPFFFSGVTETEAAGAGMHATPELPVFAYVDEAGAAPTPAFTPAEPSVRDQEPSATFRYETPEAPPRRKSFAERLRATLPLEEVLGMNLFAKIGMVLLVLGFALLGRVALIAMGPGGKVALLYAAAAALLGGGIWLERKERYRLIGRTGIGGGWALLFFTTYAMYHVPAMQVLQSETLDCVLLLGVAIAMVAHTLRYQSQLVTGLSFLLAFSTVALSQDTVYALAAGVILSVGIIAIALRMGWYELEIFGLLATYSNHFYWLYKLYPGGMAGHAFPQFWPSSIILILYWLTFRISYIARGIRSPRDERLSTVAALLNTTLLLAVMKFQSTRPELAFYALLGLGAMEFFFGQLPATRRRRSAFILLTVLGTMLMLASVPFKFSGNNIALLWMIAGEALLIAGIAQAEVLFRRLGLLTGLFTGLLIIDEAIRIITLRQHSELPLIQNGILLLTCSALFYLNTHYICRKWQHLFQGFDARLAVTHSYIGGITAFIGAWAVFTGDWTAVAWGVLLLAAALGSRRLESLHLLLQAWLFAGAVALRSLMANCHLSEHWPHHVTTRLITLPILAVVFYLAAAVLSGTDELRARLRSFTLWAGTSLLVLLAWMEVAPAWVALAWMALAVALILIRLRIRMATLSYQEHALVLLVTLQLLAVNLDLSSAASRYVPFLVCAAALYGLSRVCTLRDAVYRRAAGWTHTWLATTLLAMLAWHESPQLWLTALWAVFALALAIVDRIFDVLAALAVFRAAELNLYTLDKWHGVDVRLITVAIVVALMYALARWVRIPQALRDVEVHHVYSWVGSFLAAWLLWTELQPIAVAVGLAVFGLLLFESGMMWQQRQLRVQAYVALTAAFVRIFFINLAARRLPGETLSPALYTVAPIVLIYFFVWARLQSMKGGPETKRWPVSDFIAYFGTGCVASLLYFQASPEWIILTWAVLVIALLATTLMLDQEVFLQQAVLMVTALVVRGIAHNIFGGSYFTAGGWRGNFAVLSLTAALLFAALPIAFRVRKRYAQRPSRSWLCRYFALDYPEQYLFFAPVVLLALMIAVKMNPGMVTLAWGIEGVLVILLGLAVSQRTYRITGLLLLLLCVGKIVFRDAWRLAERDRYITFIVLGTALTLVSMLYNRYRESVRRLL